MGFKKEGMRKPARSGYGKQSTGRSSWNADRKQGGWNADRKAGGSGWNIERKPAKSFGKLELFDATCEKCGKETQVPFRPTGGKPVYCRECFKGNDGFEDKRKSSTRGSPDDLAEINRKLDKIMRALKIE